MTANLGYDSLGWSKFPALSTYEKIFYVDSIAGKDTNDGLSPANAFKTLVYGGALNKAIKAATGKKIAVLLKPGSTFSDLFYVEVGGTAAFPLLVSGSSWPGSVPNIKPILKNGILANASHLAFQGFQIANSGAGSTGIHLSVPGGTDYLIEDCLFTGLYQALLIQGGASGGANRLTNLRIRRNYFF